ncbi:MAG: DUF3857 domain-containing protein, partial [Candidatus Hydrogenedentes bacterium]|nr:DUF3857 domain-containing protein [Candidatus Hydrogenedentota bacterium]
MRILSGVICVALVTVGCAHAPVREQLTPYQGEPVAGLEGVTFDGEVFHVPDMEPVSRQDVQMLQFQAEEGPEGEGEAGQEGALSELAQSLLERGRAMAEQYPGVCGVILVDDGEFVYRKDGTSVYRYHFAGLVLKEEAKGWGQFSSGFTEGRSRVQVEFARSVAPDGTVRTLTPDALKVGSPSEAMQFFNPNQKVLSGVIPGVEVGSVVEYCYENERYAPEDPRIFFPGYFFQGTEPVVLSRARVVLPKGVTFHYLTRHFPDEASQEPVKEEGGGTVAYTWTIEDSPPLV